MIKEGKYNFSKGPYIIKKQGKNYVLLDGEDEYKIHKLDHDNLEYIEYENKIFYILGSGADFRIYDGTKDFTLEKYINDNYSGLDLVGIKEYFIKEFGIYFGENIILVTPISKRVTLNTYGVFLIFEPVKGLINTLTVKIKDIMPTNGYTITPQRFFELDIRYFFLDPNFAKRFNIKDVTLIGEDYLKYDNCYVLTYSIKQNN